MDLRGADEEKVLVLLHDFEVVHPGRVAEEPSDLACKKGGKVAKSEILH